MPRMTLMIYEYASGGCSVTGCARVGLNLWAKLKPFLTLGLSWYQQWLSFAHGVRLASAGGRHPSICASQRAAIFRGDGNHIGFIAPLSGA